VKKNIAFVVCNALMLVLIIILTSVIKKLLIYSFLAGGDFVPVYLPYTSPLELFSSPLILSYHSQSQRDVYRWGRE
jgi:hypothetical protein